MLRLCAERKSRLEIAERAGVPEHRVKHIRSGARAVPGPPVAHRHGGGEVHEAGDGTQDAGAVVDEPDEMADIPLPEAAAS